MLAIWRNNVQQQRQIHPKDATLLELFRAALLAGWLLLLPHYYVLLLAVWDGWQCGWMQPSVKNKEEGS